MATPPREIPENGLYLITRRVSQREFLLRPGVVVNNMLLFFLGHYATLYGIAIHTFGYMSNHFHLVISDPNARLPEFMRELNSMSARALNAHYGRFEHLWASGSYGEMRLDRTAEDVVVALRYVICNPVEAELVAEAKDWPGLKVLPHEIGHRTFRAERPEWFCNGARGRSAQGKGGSLGRRRQSASAGRSKLPQKIVFTTSLPNVVDASPRHLMEMVVRACKDREAEIQARVRLGGRSFLSAKRVLGVDPHSRPQTRETRWQRNPRLLAANWRRRIDRIWRWKEFLDRYARALQRFIARERDVVFPYGTYKMRVDFNVRCEPAPSG